jgi:hypothetical protein
MICERSKRTKVTIVDTKVAHPLASGGDPNDGECFFVPECTQSSGGLMGTSRNSTNGTLLPLSSFRSELVELSTSGEKLAHILCDFKSIVTYSQQFLSNSLQRPNQLSLYLCFTRTTCSGAHSLGFLRDKRPDRIRNVFVERCRRSDFVGLR